MEYGLPLPFTFSATVHVQRNGLSWTDLKIVDPDTASVNLSCAQSGALTYEYFVLIGCSRSELGRIVCELQFVRAIWTFHKFARLEFSSVDVMWTRLDHWPCSFYHSVLWPGVVTCIEINSKGHLNGLLTCRTNAQYNTITAIHWRI